MIGMENFYDFLKGAHEMDIHFKQAEFTKNMPVLLGLLGIWYINFFGCNDQALVPYANELAFFRDYIQQMDMESNGKSISQLNDPVNYATGPVILGQQGCDSQHSFFQHLHQAPHFTPVDFILAAKGEHFPQLKALLIASALSQSEALMQGRSYEKIYAELKENGYSEKDAEKLAHHKTIPGNRPSTILFLDKITPHSLGMLIALYEHKIFVQGIIWNINSFDQWGVELGKQLLPAILADMEDSHAKNTHDASTRGLIEYYRNSI
jgi:glucose-6-phosphate isomerase